MELFLDHVLLLLHRLLLDLGLDLLQFNIFQELLPLIPLLLFENRHLHLIHFLQEEFGQHLSPLFQLESIWQDGVPELDFVVALEAGE